jgi:hypothetical protein
LMWGVHPDVPRTARRAESGSCVGSC